MCISVKVNRLICNKVYELKGVERHNLPQTDSVPSVDRAISCFNKHIYSKNCRNNADKDRTK